MKPTKRSVSTSTPSIQPPSYSSPLPLTVPQILSSTVFARLPPYSSIYSLHLPESTNFRLF